MPFSFQRKLAAWLLPTAFLIAGCASGFHAQPTSARPSQSTTILFVVDGLGAEQLREGFGGGGLANFREHFLPGASSFAIARATFPTLTYPNLASILTAERLGAQPVIANHMVIEKGEMLDFESHKDHADLRRLIEPRSVIARLKASGRRTASFSYVLGMNADAHTRAGIGEGISYATHDYDRLDEELLSQLQSYLTKDPRAESWPDFIYVHLVGLDGTAHRFGPNSSEAKAYLRWLDARMGAALRTLRKGEAQGHEVISLLTGDHGFVSPTAFSDAATLFREKGVILTNESRYLGLHARKDPGVLRRPLAKARELASVELTALRLGDDLFLNSDNRQLQFRYGPALCAEEPYSLSLVGPQGATPAACPSAFDALVPPYPYLVANIASYLHARYHPDALVIAKPRYSFLAGTKGAHGGPTAAELFVPLLLRGAKMEGSAPIRTSDLLKTLE